jgi:hypothetical protein
VTGMVVRSADREAIEAEIDRVRSLGLDELRTLWRTMLRSSPPPALTKDLVARFICWHVQEQALGGFDSDTAKLLAGLARGNKPGGNGPRRLRPGTVLVREYQGERHTVTVVPGGFVWHEATYPSLSTIARAITGTAWNGPRFFGLRASANGLGESEGEQAETHAPIAHAGGLPRHVSNGSSRRKKVQR